MRTGKRTIALAITLITILGLGMTVNATNLNLETSHDSNIILGKEAEKETDEIAKVSYDMGETWIPQNENAYYEVSSTDYWTYDDYKVYCETVENDLIEMLANGEPNLSIEDINEWRENSIQQLEYIKLGGKIYKNNTDEDTSLIISGADSSMIENTKE